MSLCRHNKISVEFEARAVLFLLKALDMHFRFIFGVQKDKIRSALIRVLYWTGTRSKATRDHNGVICGET